MQKRRRAFATLVLTALVVGPLLPLRAASAPRTSPTVCATPTRTIVGGGSGQITVGAGEIVLLTGGTFTGGVNDFATGSVLCVATTAAFVPAWFNNPRGSLVVLGSATLPSLSTPETFSLRVDGALTASDINMNGPAVVTVGPAGTMNAGTISTATGSVLNNQGGTTIAGLNLNGDARVENSGSLRISSGSNANGSIVNSGVLDIGGSLIMNGGSSFDNTCVVTTVGNLEVNTAGAHNAGIIRLTGSLRVNGTFVQTTGGTLVADGLNNDGSIAGFGRYRFANDTRTQGSFAGSSAADPIVVHDLTPPPAPRIFDTQSGTVLNVVAGPITDPGVTARPYGCAPPAPANADLSVFVSGPAEATPGAPVTYTTTVGNGGPAIAAAATASLTLSPAVTIVDADGAAVSGSTLTWTLGDVTAGASTTFEVTVTAPGSGELVARVAGSSTTVDPHPGNNDGSSPDHEATTRIVADIPVNNPPVVADTQVVGSFGTPLTGALAISDPDPGQTVVATLTTPPADGTATVNPSGAFTYLGTGDFTGLDTFRVTACDNGTPPSTCPVGTVTAVLFPLATADSARTPRDTPVTIAVKDNDLGALAPGLTIATAPTAGTATVAGERIIFQPATGFVGIVGFEYKVCSPDGVACGTSDVMVVVEAPPENRPPVYIGPTTIETDAGVPVQATATATDPDPGQTLTFTLTTPPPVGAGTALVDPDGDLTFTPAPGFAGIVTIGLTVCDNGSPIACDVGEVEITVRPSTLADSASTTAGVPVTIEVLDNDLGAGPPLTVPDPSANGTATVQVDEIVFAPTAGFVGTTTFTYQACATFPNTLCSTAVVTVIVSAATPANSPPVAVGPELELQANASASQHIHASDPDGDALSYTLGTVLPTFGTATFNGDVVVYTPQLNYAGPDSFEIEICDDHVPDRACTSVTARVTVLPVARPISVATEVGQAVPVDVTPVVDGSGLVVSVYPGADPANGTAAPHGTLTLVYTPDPGFAGVDTFTYQVCVITQPTSCAAALVTVSVYPVAADFLVRTLAGIPVDAAVAESDQAGDDSVSEIVEPPIHGIATVQPDGSIRYSPSGTLTGVDTITYSRCTREASPLCSTAVLTVEVAPVVDPNTATTPEETPVSIVVGSNDFGDAGPPLVVIGPHSGTIDGQSLAALGTQFNRGRPPLADGPVAVSDAAALVYRPLPGFVGVDTFVYARCAPTAPHVCDSTVVTVTVTQVTPEPPPTTSTTTTTTATTTVPATTIPAQPVTAPPEAPTTDQSAAGGTLPSTGSNSRALPMIAVFLILIGAGLLAVRRRDARQA